MRRPKLEVADIFHRHGAAWRKANAGHVSLGQLKVMSAIEHCRSAALGGHVERCEDCGHSRIAYNSCRNRHCPKCQGAAARDWLAEKGYDPAYGARPLKRVIQKSVQDPLSELILSGRIKDGEKLVISAGKQGLTFNGKLAAAA